MDSMNLILVCKISLTAITLTAVFKGAILAKNARSVYLKIKKWTSPH